MSANLIIGSSHALSFSMAVGICAATAEEAKNTLVRIESKSGNNNHVLFTKPRPDFIDLQTNGGNNWKVTFEDPIEEIRKYNNKESAVIFMLGGNEANAYFFYKNPKPFDFFHPEHPDTDFQKQIIPLNQMKAIVEGLIFNSAISTGALAEQLPLARKYYIPPPPPIPSEEHIKRFPEIFDFGIYDLEDKNIRIKIFKIQINMMKEFCAKNNITYLDCSRSNADDQGFLREEYWDGCTHATTDYYDPIVKELGL